MGKLKIELDDLRIAFEETSGEVLYYLDVKTGKTLADIDAVYYMDGNVAEAEIIEDFYSEDFPENDRYIEIPNIKPVKAENYEDMQIFVDNIEDRQLKTQLQKVIDTKINSDYALKNFLEIMKRKPERKQWLRFRESRQENRIHKRIKNWLESQEIEIIAK